VETINSDWLHSFFRVLSVFPKVSSFLYRPELDYAATPLSDCGIERISWYLDNHITALNIEGTCIGTRGAHTIAGFITSSYTVERINLARTKLVGWKDGAPDVSGIEAIAHAISFSRPLSALTFSCQPGYDRELSSQAEDEGVGPAGVVRVDTDMEQIDISHKNIGLPGAILFAR
jgi:hypothetical protein